MWSFVNQATLLNLELLDQVLIAAVRCVFYGTIVLPDGRLNVLILPFGADKPET